MPPIKSTTTSALRPAFTPQRTDEPAVRQPTTGQPQTARGWGPSGTRQQSGATVDVSAQLAQIKKLVSGHTDRNEEKKVIDLFRKASGPELDAILGQMSIHDFHEMVDDVDDRRLFGVPLGPQNRTELLKVLSQERLGDLSTEGRAKLIHGLQYHTTDSRAEKAIRDVFLGTKGEQLTDLKRQIDGGGDYHDLQQLVFHDIDDSGVRSQILQHFQREAKPTGQVKVLSDIDDTFYVNLKDDRYPSKTVYPGLRELYRELDKGPNVAQPDTTGDVTFISARPYDRAGIIEDDLTRKMLKGNDVQATIRSGDLLHVVGNHAIADKKFENWQQERQLYPEYKRVAFGDSGQGDMYLEEKALKSGTDTAAAFLHNVTHMSDADRARYESMGITVFDTYVGAANEAFKRGLISREGLERVGASASAELSQVQFGSPDQKAAREADLNRDLAAMQKLLASGMPQINP